MLPVPPPPPLQITLTCFMFLLTSVFLGFVSTRIFDSCSHYGIAFVDPLDPCKCYDTMFADPLLMRQWEEVIQRWLNILIFFDEFILMTEILAKIPGGVISLQYADDTILFVDKDITYVENLKRILTCFELMSGMRVNYLKKVSWCL
jgi:hypothetical protein